MKLPFLKQLFSRSKSESSGKTKSGEPKEFSVNNPSVKPTVYFENTTTHPELNRLVLKSSVTATDEDLPVPPQHLMQYGEEVRVHLHMGKKTALQIRQACLKHDAAMAHFERVLEFGCSNGRILRHYRDLAEKSGKRYFGCDINANTVLWDIENLSPPFNFFVNTTAPHLPVTDGFFDFVFATSVFTHMDDLFFGWLMEIRRVISDKGYAFLTFLNQPSVEYALANPDYPVGVCVSRSPDLIDDFMKGENDMVVVNRGIQSMTFVRREFLQQLIEPYFETVAIVEGMVAGHQSGFLLKAK